MSSLRWGYQVPGTSITDGFSKKAVGTRLPIINVYVRLLIESDARDSNYILCKEQKRVCRHFILNFPHFTFSTMSSYIYLPGSSANAIISNISNYDLTQPDIF